MSQQDEGDGSKILLWVDGKGPRKYTGVAKFEPLASFFGKMLEGNSDVETLLVDQEEPTKHSAEDL